MRVFQDNSGEVGAKIDITDLPTTVRRQPGVIRSRNEGSLAESQMEAGLRALR